MMQLKRCGLSCYRLKRIRKFCKITGFAIFLVVFGVLGYFQFLIRCSEDQANESLKTLCTHYKNKEFTGSLCSSLCDENKIKRTQCDGNRSGKQVQIMTCDGCESPGVQTTVVMKTDLDIDNWTKKLYFGFLSATTTKKKVEEAIREVHAHSTSFFDSNFSEHSDVISYFMGIDYRRLLRGSDTFTAIDPILKSAIALAEQWEYLSLKVLGKQRFLPKLYGTCGPMYFVEYTPSLGKFNYVLFQSKAPDMLNSAQYTAPWKERAEVALKLLKFIVDLEDSYPRPLQMCDVKPANYGLNKDRELIYLDSDSVRFESVIPQRKCLSDNDCIYLHCSGHCNKNMECGREMLANNLQNLCRWIFVSKVEMFGLLRSPPSSIAAQLKKLLERCSYPSGGVFKLPKENKSDRKLLQDLKILLIQSLHS